MTEPFSMSDYDLTLWESEEDNCPFCPYCHDNELTVEISAAMWGCLKCDSTFTVHGKGVVIADALPGNNDGKDSSEGEHLPEPAPSPLLRIKRREG